MIYGPYSTGWRSEKARRERLVKRVTIALIVWVGVVAVGTGMAVSLKLLGVL